MSGGEPAGAVTGAARTSAIAEVMPPGERSALAAWLAESAAFSWRRHGAVLLLIVAVGIVRGAFWAATTEVWNPIDEMQHYDYARSIARGHGMPVVGTDQVANDVLKVAKVSPTSPFRQIPFQPDTANPANRGASTESYEGGGVQGPLYYAAMTVPYWVSHPIGMLQSVYALRFASVLLSMLTVPLSWYLARELLPRHPFVWISTPAILVMVQGFNANLASVNNDALALPIAVATLIPVARAWRGLSNRQAIITGLLFGLAMLTKPTNIALAPMIGLVLAGLLVSRRESTGNVLRWGVLFSGTGFLVLVPYLAWNLYTYGALSANEEVNAITGPIQGTSPFNLDSLRMHLHNARTGFFDLQLWSIGPDATYNQILERATVAAVIVGTAAALWRRRLREAAVLLWLALAFPLAFALKVAMTYGLLDSVGSVVGRHLYPALVPVCIIIASGAVTALGPRWGAVALLLLFAVALGAERDLTIRYVDASYTSGLIGSLAPRVDQSWNDEYVAERTVQATPPCPVEAVGLGISGPPPATIEIAQGTTQQEARLAASDGNVGLYMLQKPVPDEFRVMLRAGTAVGSSRQEREAAVAFVEGSGDPMVRLYCRTDNPNAERFEQRYGPQHPKFVTYERIKDWTEAWKWLGWAAFAAGAVVALGWEVRHRLWRSRS